MIETSNDSLLNDPDHLPNLLQGFKILGFANDEVKRLSKLHTEEKLTRLTNGAASFTSHQEPIQIKPVSAPVFITNQAVKNAYINGDFHFIKQLEAIASADLNAIYDNIKRNGDAAWRQVVQDGVVYWVSWGKNGMVWTYSDPKDNSPISTNPSSPTKYIQTVQFGTYSSNAGICGIHAYNLTTTTLVVESIIALIIAKVISGFIATGIDFVVSIFTAQLAAAALELGLELSFVLPEFVIPLVITCLIFAIAFIGISYLWNFINRKYTIRLQIFNYDPNYEWRVAKHYMDNGVIPGHDNGQLSFNLPKTLPARSVVVPPGFTGPITTLDSACYYGEVIYNNRNTVLEGLGFGLRVERVSHGNPGFNVAFDGPRFSHNRIAIETGNMDPEHFYYMVKHNNSWLPNPLQGNLTTIESTSLNYSMDALSGSPDNLYNIIINIKPYGH
ncbi:hypothetical protein CYY_009210 [Polysphondylium violaceum]|uniref:Uncharacterized protein n=1 Tax=Polysphondylium violaceum TaxID=133409 RepID=A0A8J4PKJ3_9MYCE|nr:hypothetical protein CYY_009210 [Polysphondylium violaceum]